jgi:hypothetical protein
MAVTVPRRTIDVTSRDPVPRTCASCLHWGPPDGEKPQVLNGHALRVCKFFSPNVNGLWPHHVSHLAKVAIKWPGDTPGDLMTSAGFGCVEWTRAPR